MRDRPSTFFNPELLPVIHRVTVPTPFLCAYQLHNYAAGQRQWTPIPTPGSACCVFSLVPLVHWLSSVCACAQGLMLSPRCTWRRCCHTPGVHALPPSSKQHSRLHALHGRRSAQQMALRQRHAWQRPMQASVPLLPASTTPMVYVMSQDSTGSTPASTGDAGFGSGLTHGSGAQPMAAVMPPFSSLPVAGSVNAGRFLGINQSTHNRLDTSPVPNTCGNAYIPSPRQSLAAAVAAVAAN